MVIITDLDGTFLGSGDTGFQALEDALTIIRRENIPLIFCSSKTRSEIERLRKQTGNHHPFVVENGGALYWPKHYFDCSIEGVRRQGDLEYLEWGTPRPELLRVLRRIRKETSIPLQSFAEMTVDEVAAVSGLSRQEALLAQQREYDEPFQILSIDEILEGRIVRRIEQANLTCVRGGRFWHILGHHDKGKACRQLLECFSRDGRRPTSIGLGDSANDLPLLQSVDIPVLVRREDGTHDPDIMSAVPGLRLEDGIGPVGWNRAVVSLGLAQK